MSRRKRRPTGVRTAQGDDAAQPHLTPEEIQAAEREAEEAEADPETDARIAAEDAALEETERRARAGEDPQADDDPPGRVTAEWPEGMSFEQASAQGLVEYDSAEAPSPEFAEIADDADEHWIGYVDPPLPDFSALFERGPLAAGLRMFEAMLDEARAGYVNAAVAELERAIDETFEPPERQFLGTVALENRTEAGLPDVAGAYRTMVRLRAEQKQPA